MTALDGDEGVVGWTEPPSIGYTGKDALSATLSEVVAKWCPWPESNQHSLRNSILSRARLPIPPQGLSDIGRKADAAKPAEYSGRALPVNPRVARSGRGVGSQNTPV
jgi:hypothetical protein